MRLSNNLKNKIPSYTYGKDQLICTKVHLPVLQNLNWNTSKTINVLEESRLVTTAIVLETAEVLRRFR